MISMIVLGLDPGLATTGFSILSVQNQQRNIRDCGTITTPAGHSLAERLSMIEEDLIALLEQYKPEVCGIEELFFTKNVKTGIAVAHARGVMLHCLWKKHIPIVELTPLEVKHQLTGDGKADKKQMAKMLELTFPNHQIGTQDDANDAIAIAMAASYMWPHQIIH